MRVDLHPEARAELRSAALWYDERSPQLADRWLASIATVLERIGASAVQYPLWPGTGRREVPIRKAVVEPFPYLLAFEVHPHRVLVLAIAHAKRRPLYWLARATDEAR